MRCTGLQQFLNLWPSRQKLLATPRTTKIPPALGSSGPWLESSPVRINAVLVLGAACLPSGNTPLVESVMTVSAVLDLAPPWCATAVGGRRRLRRAILEAVMTGSADGKNAV